MWFSWNTYLKLDFNKVSDKKKEGNQLAGQLPSVKSIHGASNSLNQSIYILN